MSIQRLWYRPARGARYGFAAFALAISLAGCRSEPPPQYPAWVPGAPSETAASSPFQRFRDAGIQAEAAGRGLADKPALAGDRARELDRRLAPILAGLAASGTGPVPYDYEPKPALGPNPVHIGWGLLGGTYQRSLADAIAAQDFDQAVDLEVQGTRFAFVVSGGDATDALTGLPLADALRRVFSPVLSQLQAPQLEKLAKGLAADLAAKPPMDTVAKHERLAMLAGVQLVQDDFRDGKLDDLERRLGPAVRDALDALRGDEDDPAKREAFFKGMAQEAQAEGDWLAANALEPAVKRTKQPAAPGGSRRPWHALARQFDLAAAPLLGQNDETLARTRLFVLTVLLLDAVAKTGSAPVDLRDFPAELDQDPYTGLPFHYVPKGRDFSIYSAGADGLDDGGETDDAYDRPDLFLEGFR